MTTKTDQKFQAPLNLEERKLVSHLVFPTWLAITIGTREGDCARTKEGNESQRILCSSCFLLLLLRLSLLSVRVGVRASVRAKKGGIGSKSGGMRCVFVASRRTVKRPDLHEWPRTGPNRKWSNSIDQELTIGLNRFYTIEPNSKNPKLT
jgi:hypothetical protein